MLRKLEVRPEGDREIVMTRAFEAPRELVFEAMTAPALLKQWLSGPPGWTMDVCEVDLKVGGSYRWSWKGPDGASMALSGVYREIDPPHRIVNTESFDDPWHPGEMIGTLVLVEHDGRTLLTNTLRYATPDARDGVLKSPMEQGISASYDQLEQMLKRPV